MPVLPERPISELGPTPTNAPNRALNPATGLPFEGRTELHQARAQYPAQQYFVTRMGANPNARPHPELPAQTFWGFNLGGSDLSADPVAVEDRDGAQPAVEVLSPPLAPRARLCPLEQLTDRHEADDDRRVHEARRHVARKSAALSRPRTTAPPPRTFVAKTGSSTA